jgi:hypothetical protein
MPIDRPIVSAVVCRVDMLSVVFSCARGEAVQGAAAGRGRAPAQLRGGC